MRLNPAYCIWEGHFSADYCDRVTVYADSLGRMEAAARYDPEKKARSSDVAWIADNTDHAWIFDPIASIVAVTNRKYWQWTITDRETLQYTRYATDQFYGWHADARSEPYPDDGRWPGLTRKISVTISLSDEADYDGGAFALEDTTLPPGKTEKRVKVFEQARRRGSIIIFASHLHHEVRPVTRGLRRSLVGWFLGPPFQ
ncbi:MAG: 2OG-Fe(II) oxygenase [Alphaproteobacteria bacterium]|nr:2OG-Fe(II) oxygenase [Alphaproteobacteria bacterium]